MLNLPYLLAFLGTLPFVFSVFLYLEKIDQFSVFSTTLKSEIFLASYSLTIVSFMCGVNWGQYLTYFIKPRINLFILSNIITIACWASYLFSNFSNFLSNLIFCFLSLLLIDRYLKNINYISDRYFQSRRTATIIVSICLFIVQFCVDGKI